MTKHHSNKVFRVIRNFYKNNSIFTVVSAVILVFVVILSISIGQDANPSNIFYPVDRYFETIESRLQSSNKSKIDFELKLAKERIDETKGTMTKENASVDALTALLYNMDQARVVKYILNDTDRTKLLIEVYNNREGKDLKTLVEKEEQVVFLEEVLKNEKAEELIRSIQESRDEMSFLMGSLETNLTNIKTNLQSMVDSEDYVTAASYIMDLSKIYAPNYERSMVARINDTKDSETKSIMKTSKKKLVSFVDEVFGIGRTKIKGNAEFDKYYVDKLYEINRKTGEDVDYYQSSISMIAPQTTEAELKELTDKVNSVRDTWYGVRDSIGVKPNDEVYDQFQSIFSKMDEIGNRLVEISQKNLKPVQN